MEHFKEMDIVEAKILNLDTGEQLSLLHKPNSGKPSKCLFVPQEVSFGEFRIRLRFDWSDLDEKNDSTLDADIFQNGEKYKSDRDKWHHTQREFENGAWIYLFKFKEIEFRFKLAITRDKNQTGVALIEKPDADRNDNS